MQQTLIFFHSIIRWILLIGLLCSIYKAYKGYYSDKPFSKTDNLLRHWTATIGHIQLIIGIILYTKSPVTGFFIKNFSVAIHNPDALFFGVIHSTLMFTAIVILTIGSALAKRQITDKLKYRTMLIWFTITLLIIFIAIPWPFSPLANRPYISHLYYE